MLGHAVQCQVMLCCAKLCLICRAVLCHAAFYGHALVHLGLDAASFLSAKHMQHEKTFLSTGTEEQLKQDV